MRWYAVSRLRIISQLARRRKEKHSTDVCDRLIDLVAEDNAIEDTIYHMTRALDSERVDLDRFLKVSLKSSGRI